VLPQLRCLAQESRVVDLAGQLRDDAQRQLHIPGV
jgi:hypothetical protein